MKFDWHYFFSAKYTYWLNIALIIFFSVLIIYECSTLKFSYTFYPQVIENNLPSAPKKNTFKDLFRSSLFGVYMTQDLNENNVKKSQLNVTLMGIMLANKMEDSLVTIRASNGEEKTYKIGDSIPGDALIKRIMMNSIVVERQGNLERLSLPKDELIFEPVAKPLNGE